MGRARDVHIMKKLTRKYFKFDVDRSSFNRVKPLYGKLINAWAKNGMDSPEADDVQDLIDLQIDIDEKEYREAKSMTKDLPEQFNQMFYKIKTKYAEKGKNRSSTQYCNNVTENYLKEYYKTLGLKH